MIEGKRVVAIRTMASRGWGIKSIARHVAVARNTVRRYLRQPIQAGGQTRPAGRRLNDRQRDEARELFLATAEGNAAVLQRLFAERGVNASQRNLRAVAWFYVAPRAAVGVVLLAIFGLAAFLIVLQIALVILRRLGA